MLSIFKDFSMIENIVGLKVISSDITVTLLSHEILFLISILNNNLTSKYFVVEQIKCFEQNFLEKFHINLNPNKVS